MVENPGSAGITSWLDSALARPASEPEVRDVIGAGFTHAADGPWPQRGASAFEAGGPADLLVPCSVLAELTGQVLEAEDGLGRLSDDELVGVLRAARRVVSWQQAVELAAVAELTARRAAEPANEGPRPAERASAEVAVALTLTSRSADRLSDLAVGVRRLPAVDTALRRGEIDIAKASVFVDELAGLGWLHASVIAGKHAYLAAGLTTGQLRQLLRRAVLSVDPDAVRRRQQKAREDARVERFSEGSGNGALAGRELPPARTLMADRHVRALAQALQRAGMPGTLDQISAEVFLALLSGESPESLLAAVQQHQSSDDTEVRTERPDDMMPPRSRADDCRPEEPDVPEPSITEDPADGHEASIAGEPAGQAADAPEPSVTGERAGQAADAPEASITAEPAGQAADAPEPSITEDPADGHEASITAGLQEPRSLGLGLSWPRGPLGTVHLTMPMSAWLGITDKPGEVAGQGVFDAWSCREIASQLVGRPGTQYCVTVTTPEGHPLGHACTRVPPPGPAPPGPAPDGMPRSVAAWIGGLAVNWLESGSCSHARETDGYVPGKLLGHLIKVRNPTCTAPGCRRPAQQSDIDHVIPYAQGGRTCECNCHPACRRHHRCKGSAGWHLEMPEPGILAWRLPHGRTYLTRAQPYPV